MTIAELAIVGLAAWRLAALLVVEQGPMDVIQRLRRVLRVEVNLSHLDANSWQRLWLCVYCMTFWTSLLMLGLWQLEPWAVYPFAVWGGSTALEMIVRKDA